MLGRVDIHIHILGGDMQGHVDKGEAVFGKIAGVDMVDCPLDGCGVY